MLQLGPYRFKRAESPEEFEAIHRLNYRTFVQEIPQHADPGNTLLIDKFHEKNVYFIALRGDRVVGMVSLHDQPPFSVASRLPDAALLEAPETRPLEVRLLAVETAERNGAVFLGLSQVIFEYAQANHYTHLFISGLEERERLYRRLGFQALGPAVASGEAWFVPMVLAVGSVAAALHEEKRWWEERAKPFADHETGKSA
jgi:N-acyl-L-homoserine lactone synthetase